MVRLFTIISRYILIFLFALYTFDGFFALRSGLSKSKEKGLYYLQNIWTLLLISLCNVILYLNTENATYIVLMVSEITLVIALQIIYKAAYTGINNALLNHLCMLLSLGLIIISRLNTDRAIKQLIIAIFAAVVTSIIPILIKKFDFWEDLQKLYAVLGIISLLIVLVAGQTVYGAKISLNIGGFSFQPTEFVKIFFVLGISAALKKAKNGRDYLILTIVSFIHIGILVLSRDLGGAVILFMIFLLLVYLKTAKLWILVSGGTLVVSGLFLVGKLMAHVQSRISAWVDPISVIDNAGYQVSQSLFAIGTGSWVGSGLTLGMPEKIPVVSKDFIFAAISEELGAVFGICLIFTYVSCIILIMNLAMQKKDTFSSLAAAGFGIAFGFQSFLSIGGVIKFIPSTGVTLPFISAGGSSTIAFFIMFSCIQGMGMKKEVKA